MDKGYRTIYSQLYDSFQVETGRLRAVNEPDIQEIGTLDARVLREMIDAAERETFHGRVNQLIVSPYTGRQLRPDAKLFLLINLLQMIVLPVSFTRRSSEADLAKALFADTVSLLKEAAEESKETDVSSHAVLKALTKNWQKLNLAALKLWED